MEALELAIAQKRVNEYTDDSARANGDTDAGGGRKNWLQTGIEAYRWISRAEETIREAVAQGLIDQAIYEHSILPAIERVYTDWLTPFEHVEALVVNQSNGVGDSGTLAEFRQCGENVRDWLERHEWTSAAKRSRRAALRAEPW